MGAERYYDQFRDDEDLFPNLHSDDHDDDGNDDHDDNADEEIEESCPRCSNGCNYCLGVDW